MATRDSLLSYYTGNSKRFDQLQDRFGDYLERLSAIDKLGLINIISGWQLLDTSAQGDGNDPISFDAFLKNINQLEDVPPNSQLPSTLQLLRGCTEGEALTLLQCLASQLREGCYL